MKGDIDTRLAVGIVLVMILGAVFGAGRAHRMLTVPGTAPKVPQGVERMTSGEPDAQRIILPVRIAKTIVHRAGALVELVIERQGVKFIERLGIPLDPGRLLSLEGHIANETGVV